MEFINKMLVCEINIVSPEELITYESLAQQAMCEYRDLVYSKRWEPASGK